MNWHKFILSLVTSLVAHSVYAATPQQLVTVMTQRVRQQAGNATSTETVGYPNSGTSSNTITAGLIICGGKFTASHDGNITEISIYAANSNEAQDIKVGVYIDSIGPENLIGSAEHLNIGVLTADWQSFSANIPVTSGSTYWLAYVLSTASSWTAYYNTGGTLTQYYKSVAYGLSFPNPLTSETGNGSINSIKATLTY